MNVEITMLKNKYARLDRKAHIKKCKRKVKELLVVKFTIQYLGILAHVQWPRERGDNEVLLLMTRPLDKS